MHPVSVSYLFIHKNSSIVSSGIRNLIFRNESMHISTINFRIFGQFNCACGMPHERGLGHATVSDSKWLHDYRERATGLIGHFFPGCRWFFLASFTHSFHRISIFSLNANANAKPLKFFFWFLGLSLSFPRPLALHHAFAEHAKYCSVSSTGSRGSTVAWFCDLHFSC